MAFSTGRSPSFGLTPLIVCGRCSLFDDVRKPCVVIKLRLAFRELIKNLRVRRIEINSSTRSGCADVQLRYRKFCRNARLVGSFAVIGQVFQKAGRRQQITVRVDAVKRSCRYNLPSRGAIP